MVAHYVRQLCATKPNLRALALCLAILTVMVFGNITPSHAASNYSVNVFANSGFENPPGFTNGTIPGWGREFFDANVGSATGVDCGQAVFGDCSARLDIAQSDIRLSNQSETITFGHTSLFQVLPPNTYFDNLTDRPDGLDLWLYIQPKFTDYPLVQLRFKAGSTIEMDYVLINVPLLGTGESNSTNQGEAGKAIKSFVLPAPPLSHWGHIERNVKRDWESPMRLSNGTIIPGFQLNDTLFRVEIEAYYYKDTSSGKVYGETVWADSVNLYVNSNTPPPPPAPSNYYANFNLIDSTGTSVNSLVKWKLFNSTGSEVAGYTKNDPSLMFEPYYLDVYYPTLTGQNPEPYRIFHERIRLNMTLAIPLQMYPQTLVTGGYVAFNNTVASLNLFAQDNLVLNFTATRGSTGPYLIVADAPSRPLFVTLNNTALAPTQWTYDQTNSLVRMRTSDLGLITIVFKASLNWARFDFTDLNGNLVNSKVAWQLYNASGSVPYNQGDVNLRGGQAYKLNVYYPTSSFQIYLVKTRRVPLNVTTNIQLAMIPESSTSGGYIVFNNTIASINIAIQDTSHANFTATPNNNSPYSIIMNVPRKVLSVQRTGVTLTEGLDWTFDAANSAIRITTNQLGTFFIDFRPTYIYPVVTFHDFQGKAVDPILTTKIFDSKGNIVNNTGAPLPQDNYTLEVYFAGYLMYKQSLTTSSNQNVQLSMMPIGTTQGRYIAINSIITSITILENNAAQLQFSAVGESPTLIMVSVPSKPLTIALDGKTINNWTYNSTTSTIAIQTSELGTFTLTFSDSRTPPIPVVYVGAAIGAIALVTAGLILWERTRSKTPTLPRVEEKPVTKEQPKSKTRTPRKGQRG